MALRVAAEDVPEHALVSGNTVWTCVTEGIVYPTSLAPALLLELLFDGEWSVLPPQ